MAAWRKAVRGAEMIHCPAVFHPARPETNGYETGPRRRKLAQLPSLNIDWVSREHRSRGGLFGSDLSLDSIDALELALQPDVQALRLPTALG